MLEAIVDGQSDVAVLAELARGRMRSKRAELEHALAGRVRDHHRFLIAKHLIHIDVLDEQLADCDDQIAKSIQTQLPPAPSTQSLPGATLPLPPPVSELTLT